jgi:hypothetical protein
LKKEQKKQKAVKTALKKLANSLKKNNSSAEE